jgi:hypothetical protein
MDRLEYVGRDLLTLSEQNLLSKISEEEFLKLQRTVHNELMVKVHIKALRKDGNRKLYDLHIHATAPGNQANSSKASDWDFTKALHKGFDDVSNFFKKKLGD